MLDGRIDVHGTLEELKAQGKLEVLEKDTRSIQKQEKPADVVLDSAGTAAATAPSTKRPRELVKAETRQVGSVKWKTHNTYMQAASYYTWVVLFIGIVLYQGLVVSEKLWIKRWGEVSALS